MPSRTKITISLLLFTLVIALVAGLSIHSPLHTSQNIPAAFVPLDTTNITGPTTTTAKQIPHASVGQATNNDELLPAEPANFIHATFIVASTSYTLIVPPENTLESGMQMLVTQTTKLPHPFTFTQKEYPGMGEFVESINGIPNDTHDFWFVYVNGTEAPTGISNIVVHSGDTIDWRYEHESHF
jgi:hypothetical protein